MAQAFCSRPLTAEARVRVRVILCEICEQSCTGTGFFRVLWFPPISIIPQWLFIHIFLADEK
jgi:hypothetical protein